MRASLMAAGARSNVRPCGGATSLVLVIVLREEGSCEGRCTVDRGIVEGTARVLAHVHCGERVSV
jgi:hypothetical protein